jgi:hypothetical protein
MQYIVQRIFFVLSLAAVPSMGEVVVVFFLSGGLTDLVFCGGWWGLELSNGLILAEM